MIYQAKLNEVGLSLESTKENFREKVKSMVENF